MIFTILIILIILILVGTYYRSRFEHYGEGAYIQLVAKDAQDTYLTNDAWKYMYYPVYDPHYGYVYGYPGRGYPFYGGLRPKKSENIHY